MSTLECRAAGRQDGSFRVVVLTCDGLGLPTAEALAGIEGVEVVGLVTTPHRRGTLRNRMRRIYRTRGLTGFAAIAAGKARSLARALIGARPRGGGAVEASFPVLHFRDLHDPDCLAALGALAPDLAVVDGTYILKESVFALPRLGSINLHCGKVPEYRGSPPAFWELFDGVDRVGITVHRVTAGLDEGPVLLQALFPLELAPSGDPVAYVREYWERVLRPNGVRMLAEAVARLARGTAEERPQGSRAASTHRTPDRHQLRELRRRVRLRRALAASKPPHPAPAR